MTRAASPRRPHGAAAGPGSPHDARREAAPTRSRRQWPRALPRRPRAPSPALAFPVRRRRERTSRSASPRRPWRPPLTPDRAADVPGVTTIWSRDLAQQTNEIRQLEVPGRLRGCHATDRFPASLDYELFPPITDPVQQLRKAPHRLGGRDTSRHRIILSYLADVRGGEGADARLLHPLHLHHELAALLLAPAVGAVDDRAEGDEVALASPVSRKAIDRVALRVLDLDGERRASKRGSSMSTSSLPRTCAAPASISIGIEGHPAGEATVLLRRRAGH